MLIIYKVIAKTNTCVRHNVRLQMVDTSHLKCIVCENVHDWNIYVYDVAIISIYHIIAYFVLAPVYKSIYS